MNKRNLTIVVAAILVATAFRANVADAVTIEPQVFSTAVFGESDAEWTFAISSVEPIGGRVTWVHSANDRTISRGESVVKFAVDKSAPITVKLRIPAVREGVVFPTEFELKVYRADASQPLASLRKTIWVFPNSPFADRKKWLAELNVALYDTESETTKIFDEFEIPVRRLRSSEAIGDVKSGVVIIGEGVSLKTRRGLYDAMVAAAKRGIVVICLAPSGGSFPLPGSNEEPAPGSLSLRRDEIIGELDKRLDPNFEPGSNIVATRWAIQSSRGNVVVEPTDSGSGWPWIEVRYDGGGVLVFCGFGVIEQWNSGPTPRFLFARILERLTKP